MSDDEDYRLQHRAPTGEDGDGAPMHDIESVLPNVHEHPEYYRFGSPGEDESLHHIRRVRGKPEAKVRIYRALPAEHVHKGFQTGDWVSPSKDYARQHGQQYSETGHDDWPVISTTVPAKHLFNEGYPTEFGYGGPAKETSSVAFKGGRNQEVRQHADGVIRKVVRRQLPETGTEKESSVQHTAGRYSDALENRRDLHEDAATRGHDMHWRRGISDGKPGNHFEGECKHCGATASVGATWTSSDHPRRDARQVPCTGPGTKWQSDMERELGSKRFNDAVSQYGQAVKDEHDRQWLREQGVEASRLVAVLQGFAHLPGEQPEAFARRTASSGPKITVVAHVSGNSIDVMHCFAGETRYLTSEGPRSFAETVGTTQRVLTSSGGVHDGEWVEAPIRYYGDQQLWEVTLKRNKRIKVIRTTAGHRWLVGRPGAYRTVVTEDLRPEHRLAHLRPRKVHVQANRDGIREGVMFGDGSIARRDYGAQTYGYITLWGDKAKDLGEYFEEICPSEPIEASRETGLTGLRFSSGMAGWTKDLPVISADPAVLRGWLMGYIATDGEVDQFGKVSLNSSVIEHLEHVRTVALALGVGTYGITTRMRKGYGAEKSASHSLAFATSDLDESWLLRQKHRDNFNKASRTNDRFGWTVVSIEQTDAVEAVYCAEVPGTESFALEDNIWTKNCPFCGSGALVARSDGTIECNFCTSVFTVQVQPQFAAFPQTAEGTPYQWPGQPGPEQLAGGGSSAMGGFPGPVAGEEDPEAEGGDGNPFADSESDEPDDGSEGGGDDSDGDGKAQVGGKDAPPFGKKKSSLLYRTATGHLLDEASYLQHLAISHARNRGVVARVIRESR